MIAIEGYYIDGLKWYDMYVYIALYYGFCNVTEILERRRNILFKSVHKMGNTDLEVLKTVAKDHQFF